MHSTFLFAYSFAKTVISFEILFVAYCSAFLLKSIHRGQLSILFLYLGFLKIYGYINQSGSIRFYLILPINGFPCCQLFKALKVSLFHGSGALYILNVVGSLSNRTPSSVTLINLFDHRGSSDLLLKRYSLLSF